jgi:cyclopropane fatty-acyl-phospholipid synthase-like methyltransferase
VGCGNGAVLSAFREIGIQGEGLEYADAALRVCKEKGLNVRKFDLEHPSHLDSASRADLVLSTEVAEHLPASVAETYIELLIRLCGSDGHVIMTAATPGQGGTDHVNEQPNTYWIQRFQQRGARYLDAMTQELRAEWKRRGVDRHRAKNVLAFEVAPKSAPSSSQ